MLEDKYKNKDQNKDQGKILIKDSSFIRKSFIGIFLSVICFYLIIVILTYGVCLENKEYNGYLDVEGSYIKETLLKVKYPSVKNDNIVIVSFNDLDYKSNNFKKSLYQKDASVDEYSRVIEIIMNQHPKKIFLSWFSSSHINESSHSLSNLIKKYPYYSDNFFMTLTFSKIWNYSLGDLKYLHDINCNSQIQMVCPVVSNKNWSILNVNDKIENIYYLRNNYILNTPSSHDITSYSFSDIVNHRFNSLEDKIIFIGNDIVQNSFKNEKEQSVIRRVKTIKDFKQGNPLYKSTPIHIFLAEISQMFEDGNIIRNVSNSCVILILFLSMSIIVVLFLFKYFLISLFFLISLKYILVYLNTILVQHYLYYIPVFPIVYFSSIFFLFIGLTFCSYYVYINNKISSNLKRGTIVSTLKSNFISLISHNLNTPVSRLFSLISMFITSISYSKEVVNNKDTTTLIQKLKYFIVMLQLSTKYSLSLNALKSIYQPSSKRDSISSTIHRFNLDILPILNLLGIESCNFNIESLSDEEKNLPLKIDPSLFNLLILSFILKNIINESRIESIDFNILKSKFDYLKIDMSFKIVSFSSTSSSFKYISIDTEKDFLYKLIQDYIEHFVFQNGINILESSNENVSFLYPIEY